MILEKADISKKAVLWNLLQKYLYEFSVYYRDQVEDDGNFAIRILTASLQSRVGKPG